MANESFVREKERPPRQGGRIDQHQKLRNQRANRRLSNELTTFSLPALLLCPFRWAWLPPCPFAVPPTLHW